MKISNTIYIIGAGAIGKSLAVFLKMAGKQVVLLRGSVEEGSTQIENIRIEAENGLVHETEIAIATLGSFPTLNGIVVLANKSYGNQYLATALKSKAGSSPIVLLQNGLGVEKPFMTNDFPEVYRCVLFVTSQIINQTSIRFKPVATCPVGLVKGHAKNRDNIVQQLYTPHFRFKSEEHIQQIIWKKAIINCVFNSVCPLLEVDNGIFHRNINALEIARRVISECAAIARDMGVLVDPGEVEQTLLQISKSSDGQLISTLQDIYNKRKTEIETLNFEVVRIAASLQKTDLVQQTKLLGELTKLKADVHLYNPELNKS